ncbi:nuclear membrane protein [Crepidotus variabilis]|uniref:Nuclear membrane protein n=1 Tax=Crepidotus variabilis TaxID=179855 RepID=A0A9P6EI35_9AGAR|nr:nuclear membrane protein [Crepidotus variabilis]
MAGRFPGQNQRSKEAPMDFQWTNRSPVKPAWAVGNDEPSTPRKRSHDTLNPATPNVFNSPGPTFGANQNIPFLFQPVPVPQTPHSHSWAPPSQFSPSKPISAQPELKDIDMSEASPASTRNEDDDSPMKENEASRPVATGGLRRIFNQRTKKKETRLVVARRSDGSDEEGSGSENEGEGRRSVTPFAQTTSNHYTLNMPAPAPPPSDLPYVLLGYLQFFFNLSLILIFLYLFVQFIFTVQRDVEHRISEYRQDIIQEISMCSTQFKNNLCATSPIPAMIQQCANWDTCMNRDPTVVGRAKVGAELIAEVINGFVEPISWKTLLFTLSSLAFLTVFINTLLSLYRSKHQPIPDPPRHGTPHFPIAPATPFPQNMGYLSPAPTPSWGRHRSEQDMESPTRRRRLEGGMTAKIK